MVKITIEEKKNLAVNVANTLMTGKIGNKEYLIEEYMDLYYETINSDEKTVSKEEVYYLATNIANTFMKEKIGDKEDLVEEYMEFYNKAIEYNTKRKESKVNYFNTPSEDELITRGRGR